jgi:hypothetical protein
VTTTANARGLPRTLTYSFPQVWFGHDGDVPRAVHAGPWIAQHGQFFDGWGRRADDGELPGLAAAQAARTGWTKVIADWGPGDEPLPADVLSQVVEAVHAVGGRVAVHSQQAAAVKARVDSLEHGMCLNPGTGRSKNLHLTSHSQRHQKLSAPLDEHLLTLV